MLSGQTFGWSAIQMGIVRISKGKSRYRTSASHRGSLRSF